MRFIIVVYLFCFSALSVYGQSDFHFEKEQKKIVIPFILINNLIFIPIEVNGEPLTFLLDTGVVETVLFSLDDKEEIKFYNVESIKLKGLGSKDAVDAYKSSQNRLNCKGFADYNHELYIILDQEFNFSSQVGIPVNGIIGYDFFKNHLVEINYDRKKIVVYNPAYTKIRKRLARGYQQDSISKEENKPYYQSTVKSNGMTQKAKMLLDTGNSDALWVFLSKTHVLQLPEKTIDDYLGRGFSGAVYGKRGRIDYFTFGNHTFEKPIGTFPDSLSIKSTRFVDHRVGSIGGEVLSRFTMVFDYPNGKCYSKPNGKIHDPFHYNMSGIEVQHEGLEWVKETYTPINAGLTVFNNTVKKEKEYGADDNLKIKFELKPVFVIYNIRAGSPAAQAGLRIKDKILTINGRTTHDLTIEKINDLLKSEEGKTITMEVERDKKVYKYKFQLKSIL